MTRRIQGMEIHNQQYERNSSVPGSERGKENTIERGSSIVIDKGLVKNQGAIEEKVKASNINVYVRIRPLTREEIMGGEKSCIQVLEDSRFIKVVDYGYGYHSLSRTFQFDGCLGPDISQAKIMEKCKMKMLLDSVLEGYSAAVMASGQTGSGKTYTMCGRHEGRVVDCGEHDGLIARSVDYFFKEIKKRSGENDKKPYSLKASYYEIYNEQVNDLLRLDSAPREVRWSVKDGFYVDNLLLVECESVEDVFAVLHEGAKNRKVGSHDLNKDSSRSHCIMTLHLNSTSWFGDGPPIVKYGKMLFVDLAGSERLKKSKSSGEMLRETGNINRSLFTLGKVISALSEGRKDDLVPYRESLLTKLLMDCLGGSSLALMIACVSPASSAVDETLSTLCYATCTKTIVNIPSVNIDPRDEVIMRLRKEIMQLKDENNLLKSKLGMSLQAVSERTPECVQQHSCNCSKANAASPTVKVDCSFEGFQEDEANLESPTDSQFGWMLDKEKMLTQLRTAEKLLSNKMPRKSSSSSQEDADRVEDDGFEEITNLEKWSHSLPNLELGSEFSDGVLKGQPINYAKIHRGGSDELNGLMAKQNEIIGYYRGLETAKSKGFQPFIRRNRVSVDHLSPRIKSKVSPKTQSIKPGVKDNGFQGSITVNQNAFLRLLDINSSEDDIDVFNY